MSRAPTLFLCLLLAGTFLATSGSAAPAPATLVVMSYNIHHGEGLDAKVDLERIAKLIVTARADIVGLQEVDRGVERTQRRNLPEELAKLTGLAVHFEKNIAHQGGEYGNAVLTRFPVKRAKNTHFKMLGPGEQRGVLQLVLDVRGREVLFMTTHLDARREPAERESSVLELQEIIAQAGPMPVILCGDFNATPDSPAMTRLRASITDAWPLVGQGPGLTIPVAKPTKRIDYIFVSRDTVEPVKMEVLRSDASDHLPIVAELRLK